MRIVFFGSAPFSTPTLKRLLQSPHSVVGVVTAPDRPRGRGRKLQPTEVKIIAVEHDVPVLAPAELYQRDFLDRLQSFSADLFVVVAYRILPPEVFRLPSKGAINLHASLLPKYRGAAPIHWAIINGEKKTGVTTFFLEEKVDTGDILLQKEVDILPLETTGELSRRLSEIGADLVLETVDLVGKGSPPAYPQQGQPTPAPKVNREMGRIQWRESPVRIARLIRGLSPRPGAYTHWRDKTLNLLRAEEIAEEPEKRARPGTVIRADARSGDLLVVAGDGKVRLLEIQPAGRRVLSAAEFIRGYRIQEGDVLGSRS